MRSIYRNVAWPCLAITGAVLAACAGETHTSGAGGGTTLTSPTSATSSSSSSSSSSSGSHACVLGKSAVGGCVLDP